MKLIAAPILFLILLTQIFSQWLLIAEYNLNKEYIAKNLCINKEKPKLLCSGKCQLMKKMAEEESANSNTGSKSIKNTLEVLYDDELNSLQFNGEPTVASSASTPYILKAYTSPILPFFHPPAFLS